MMLPPTNSKVLMGLVISVCVLLCVPLYSSMISYLEGGNGLFPIVPLLIGSLVVGLWRLTEWARITITVLILLYAIIYPLGLINPFAAMDIIDPPPVSDLAIRVYPPIVLSVLLVFWIGRYKDNFRKKLI